LNEEEKGEELELSELKHSDLTKVNKKEDLDSIDTNISL
jgi:hypothetical protein